MSKVATTVRAWVRAARLPAQSNIAVPLLCGQALAYYTGLGFDPRSAVFVFSFGLFDQLAIVFSNDAADEETDRKNSTFTPFSGGSRVLVEGALTRASLLRAAVACGALALASLAALSMLGRSNFLVPLGAFGLSLLWAYSFPPFRLSYRGGGEVLQVLGTGIVLPVVGFLGQGGRIESFSPAWLALLVPLRLACACATSLPDEPSDRASSKRTLVVLLSSFRVSLLMFALALMSLGAALALGGEGGSVPTMTVASLVPAFVLASLSLAFSKAAPGTRAMLIRAGSAVAATLAFEIALAIQAFRSAAH